MASKNAGVRIPSRSDVAHRHTNYPRRRSAVRSRSRKDSNEGTRLTVRETRLANSSDLSK